MSTLYALAEVLRSKNAGPLLITIDLLFENRTTFDRVVGSEVLTPSLVAELYAVSSIDVRIATFDAALAIKISFPRIGATSGAPGDRDVNGAQQHLPIANIDIP